MMDFHSISVLLLCLSDTKSLKNLTLFQVLRQTQPTKMRQEYNDSKQQKWKMQHVISRGIRQQEPPSQHVSQHPRNVRLAFDHAETTSIDPRTFQANNSTQSKPYLCMYGQHLVEAAVRPQRGILYSRQDEVQCPHPGIKPLRKQLRTETETPIFYNHALTSFWMLWSAPLANSKSTMDKFPLEQADMRAVSPSCSIDSTMRSHNNIGLLKLTMWFTSAPWESSSRTAASRSRQLAIINGVSPYAIQTQPSIWVKRHTEWS